jgi:hypothetical protein
VTVALIREQKRAWIPGLLLTKKERGGPGVSA